ncbi:MAG: hypothetical protein QOI51_2394 [Nocardioidaceae bacterium]|nr:hypothetical protein [Nocardioidaceae bacterium]
MSGSGTVAGFLPSASGFHFANSWPHQPDITVPLPTGAVKIGDAANGLCGGMTYAVRDFFEASLPIPANVTNPPLHSPLYAFIVRRLFDSFDIPGGVMKYLSWQAPTRNQFRDTVEDEWPKIKAGVDAGQPVPLGLIRTRSFWPGELGKNHQVLAFGYDEDEAHHVTIHLYDPNHPDDDDVRLTFSAGDPAAKPDISYVVSGNAAGGDDEEFTYGCFVTSYRHVSPGDIR